MAKEGGDTWRIKLLVDKNSETVLFAEAEKDFVDFLFHIMTLPVGTVIMLLKNKGMGGCVGNLYRSIQNISDVYMQYAANKEALLKPKSPSCEGASFPILLPDSSPSARKTYYKCSNNECRSGCPNVAEHPNETCPKCGRVMTEQIVSWEKEKKNWGKSHSSGYVKEVVTYIVMDNLEVKPMSAISCITMILRFDLEDVGDLEEKVIAVGVNEALELLKASFYSKNVLTDVFLGKV